MFYKQKSNVIFRNYDSFGYITDNRNFGYKRITDVEDSIGDKILSESGAVFFSVLENTPQTFDDLVKKISGLFQGVDVCTIKQDTKEFYSLLEKEGFIVSGETLHECEENDIKFSYKTLESEVRQENFASSVSSPEKSTQEFLEEYFNGNPQLTNLHIEITSKCNERCLHCYIPHEHKVSEIDPALFYNVLSQCKNMRLLHLTLSGGEPMLHRNFCDFLKRCREYEFSVNVLSNLTLLNQDIIREMKANPLLGVQVSLYSMDSNVHDSITQVKGSFEKTKNAILMLIENDIPLQISCPIMKQNKNSFAAVKEWGKKHKIHVGDDFVIIASYDHTTENLLCRLSLDDVKELIYARITDDKAYLERLKDEAEKKRSADSTDDYICSVCNSSLCIADSGNVYPCAGWQDFVVGNVKEASLKEIWSNSLQVRYLRGLRKSALSACIQCAEKDFCTMCMVRNANESPVGDPLAVNEYFCAIAKFTKQVACEVHGFLA